VLMNPRSGSLKLFLFRSIRQSRRSYGNEKEIIEIIDVLDPLP
jgi:hypothetical protein